MPLLRVIFLFCLPLFFSPSLAAFKDFDERKTSLAKKPSVRAKQLRAFALNAQYASAERQRAAALLVKESSEAARIKAKLLEAELKSRAFSNAQFMRTLTDAKAEAQRQKSKKWIAIFDDLKSLKKSAKSPNSKNSWGEKEQKAHARFFERTKLVYAPLHFALLQVKERLKRSKADTLERKNALRKLNNLYARLRTKAYRSRDFHALRVLYFEILAPYSKTPEDALHTYFEADRFHSNLERPKINDVYFYLWSSRTFRQCQNQFLHCLQSEKMHMGEHSFFDFSTLKPTTTFDHTLGSFASKMFEPLISACIQEHANLVSETHLELNWSVSHKGRVSRSEIWRPKRLRKSPFDKCVKDALSHFRYPPYQGEIKTIGLTFDID